MNNHLIQRAKERANIDLTPGKIKYLKWLVMNEGEHLYTGDNGSRIYKVKFNKKTIYPVISEIENRILTILAENQVSRDINRAKKKSRKKK